MKTKKPARKKSVMKKIPNPPAPPAAGYNPDIKPSKTPKPSRKASKPSKARYNQPGKDLDPKDAARGALKTLRHVATGMLIMKLHSQLKGSDTVSLPRDLVDANLDILAALEINIIQQAGLEDDYADLDDCQS